MKTPENATVRRLAVLVFTDLAGSVALKNRLGDEDYCRLISLHDDLFKRVVARSPEALILKDCGDGFMALFATPRDAVTACLEFQRDLHLQDAFPGQIRARIGVHVGEVTELEKESTGLPKLVGKAADMASRVMGLALPGQVLLTRGVFDDARHHVRRHPGGEGPGRPFDLRWLDHGEYFFHGNDESVGIYEVGAEGIAPLKAPEEGPKGGRRPSEGSDGGTARPVPVRPSKRVIVSLKRGSSQEESLARGIEAAFVERGHEVFIDRQAMFGIGWAREIEAEIRGSDVLIALLSAASSRSEMLEWEVCTAVDEAQKHEGRPKVLTVRVAFDGPLAPELAAILDRHPYLFWLGPQDDAPLMAKLLDYAVGGPPPSPPPRAIPLGGLPLNAPTYIERRTDLHFQTAITRRDSTILIRGARQMGKTSLLARGLDRARKDGARVAFTDFQRLDRAAMQSPEVFYKALGAGLADSLGLSVRPRDVWDPDEMPNVNFESYMLEAVLGDVETPLIWAMDEVDRLFSCPFGTDVFALLRTWHNARTMDLSGRWSRLTLAIAYATEAHLFITDPSMSPFNVGTLVALADFQADQLADLNLRYGSPLRDEAELRAFFELVGGHPYLSNRSLFEMAEGGEDLASFAGMADREEGLFGDHLRRMLVLLAKDPELCEAVRDLIQGRGRPSPRAFYRLRAAGVIAGDFPEEARPRCRLYETYLRKHLG